MRRYSLMIALAVSLLGASSPAQANCVIIDQLDKLFILQTNLAKNPKSLFFRDNIRQIRMIMGTMANRDMLEAVEGNPIFGRGASFARFLRNTQSMLQSASLDDPYSVQPHFTRATRQNLRDIGGYMTTLRCTDDQIALDQSALAAEANRDDSDAEDIEEVVAVLTELAKEVFQWRTLVIILVIALITTFAAPKVRNWLKIQRRRTKRRNTSYATQYRWHDRIIEGMLLDINCYGTKLRHEADNPLPKGSSVEIAIDGDWSQGTVMWSNVHYSGVQFKTAISLQSVDIICAAHDQPPQMQNGAPKDAVS